MIRATGIIPIEYNERLKAMARKPGLWPTDCPVADCRWRLRYKPDPDGSKQHSSGTYSLEA